MRRTDDRAGDISTLLSRRAGLRGRTLGDKLSHARGVVPGYVRKEAGLLAEAERFRGHPKLAGRIAERDLDHAYRVCRGHLEGRDRRGLRRSRFLDWLAGLAFQFLLLALLIGAVLVWRGFV